MGDKPLWEQIGSQFVQIYYQHFDNDRAKVGDLYVSKAPSEQVLLHDGFYVRRWICIKVISFSLQV